MTLTPVTENAHPNDLDFCTYPLNAALSPDKEAPLGLANQSTSLHDVTAHHEAEDELVLLKQSSTHTYIHTLYGAQIKA